jgi:hexosaminidase
MGNFVVMSPGNKAMYWDHAYGNLDFEPDTIGRQEGDAPLSKIYAYDPVPAGIAENKKNAILGVQANLWSEYICSTTAHEYLTYPRMLALSETAWTLPANKDWNDFVHRTANQYQRFDEKKINYRLPEPLITAEKGAGEGNFTVTIFSPLKGAKIRYTTDGSVPGKTSMLYSQPVRLKLKPGEVIHLQAVSVNAKGVASAPASLELPR